MDRGANGGEGGKVPQGWGARCSKYGVEDVEILEDWNSLMCPSTITRQNATCAMPKSR